MKDLLPSMEFEFEIDVKGNDTNKSFTGKFKYKRLNLLQKTEAAKMKARLDSDLNLPVEVYFIHEMLSWLRYGLIEFPDWWKDSEFGSILYDNNVIEEIYSKINEFEENWKKSLLGKK